jgi:battenin
MLFIPVLMAVSYILLPTVEFAKSRFYEEIDDASDQITTSRTSSNDSINSAEQKTNEINTTSENGFINKIKLIRPLLKYMIPLFLVYFAEYFINQGLFELLFFKNAFIKDHKLQYRWYNVCYQLAVFISRSSIKWIKIKHISLFAVFQLLNVFIFLSIIFFDYVHTIWIIFALILWEGLLGGGCYVNAFYQVSIEIPKNVREISIAITSIADSFGIALAGFTGKYLLFFN